MHATQKLPLLSSPQHAQERKLQREAERALAEAAEAKRDRDTQAELAEDLQRQLAEAHERMEESARDMEARLGRSNAELRSQGVDMSEKVDALSSHTGIQSHVIAHGSNICLLLYPSGAHT